MADLDRNIPGTGRRIDEEEPDCQRGSAGDPVGCRYRHCLIFQGDRAMSTNQVQYQRGLGLRECMQTIDECIAHPNTDPEPFIRTRSAGDILQKVTRANSCSSAKQNETLHQRASCFCGSCSSTDGRNKNAVSRSIGRRLLIVGRLYSGDRRDCLVSLAVSDRLLRVREQAATSASCIVRRMQYRLAVTDSYMTVLVNPSCGRLALSSRSTSSGPVESC